MSAEVDVDEVQILCLLPGPSVPVRTEADDRPTRWCFTCRKHVPHMWTCTDYPPDSPHYGYYDPIWTIRCPKGHSDIYFPGCGPW